MNKLYCQMASTGFVYINVLNMHIHVYIMFSWMYVCELYVSFMVQILHVDDVQCQVEVSLLMEVFFDSEVS